MATATNKQSRKASARKIQVRVTRLLLTILTLVVMGVFSVRLFSVSATIFTTQVKLIGIYQDIQYCEGERERALQVNRWEYAEEMDNDIEKLQEERSALVHSDDALVAFASQWQASFFMLAFSLALFAVIAWIWMTIFRFVLSFWSITDRPWFLKVLVKWEERILVVALVLLTGLLSYIFYLLLMGTGKIYDQTSGICKAWGLSKPEIHKPNFGRILKRLKRISWIECH